MSKTIAKVLRDRKTIINTLTTAQHRALGGAVSEKDKSVDFNTAEYTDVFLKNQCTLRQLKTQVALKTASKMVKIPEDIPVPEAGSEVSLYQAILVRDDLKSQKQFFEKLIAVPTKDIRWNRRMDEQEDIEKQRNFDFEATVKLIDKIQDSIDTVDALIQYVDNTEKL